MQPVFRMISDFPSTLLSCCFALFFFFFVTIKIMTASSAHSLCSMGKFTSSRSTQIQLPSTCLRSLRGYENVSDREKTWQRVAELKCAKMVLTRDWCDTEAAGSSGLTMKRNPRLKRCKREESAAPFRTTLNLYARSCVSVCVKSSDTQPGKRAGLRGATLTSARQDANVRS